MRVLNITQHVPPDELEQRYRQAHDPVEKIHWQIIWLHTQGRSVKEIAEITTYSTIWIYAILHRYDEHGPDEVGDRRHQNPGKKPLASPEIRDKLAKALEGAAPDGGLWTSKKVAAWLAQELGVDHVHIPRGWELLRALGYRPYAPRPQHAKADRNKQEEWKKTD